MTLVSWVSDTGTTLALDGSGGVHVQRDVKGFDGPPIRNTIDERIGDGALRVNSRRPERVLQLPLLVDENTITAGEVVRLFQSGTFVASSGRELRSVVYEAGLEGQWSVDTGGINGLSHRKFVVTLVALDPWWYGGVQTVTGSFGAPTAWNAAVAWSAAIPWNGGASQLILNEGDVPASADIVIDPGTGNNQVVSMSLGGVGGWETDFLLTGEYTTVSTVAGRRGPTWGSAGHFNEQPVRIDWTLLTAASQLFELPVGLVELVFGISAGGGAVSGDEEWHVIYRPRYFTP